MKTIKLKKVEIAEIEALQTIVQASLNSKNANLKKSANFFGDIILIEIMQALYYNFRGKIESKQNRYCDFSVSLAQAVTILISCSEVQKNESFNSHVAEKYKNILHQEIINLT